MSNAIHAAHVITSDAVALGDPEIIVMTVDVGQGADEVERISFTGADLRAAQDLLRDRGWTPYPFQKNGPAMGYTIIPVART